MATLDEDNKEYIVEKAARGYDAEEIHFLFKDEKDLPIAPAESTIRDFMESEEAKEMIEVRENIRDKRTDVSKQDLVETLVNLKNDLEKWHDELKDTEHGVTRNEAISNMIDTVNKIGELIGELESGGIRGNVVKVDEMNNYVEQNFSQVIQHLPKEEKRDIVEQLEEDDDIEEFAIKKRGET